MCDLVGSERVLGPVHPDTLASLNTPSLHCVPKRYPCDEKLHCPSPLL